MLTVGHADRRAWVRLWRARDQDRQTIAERAAERRCNGHKGRFRNRTSDQLKPPFAMSARLERRGPHSDIFARGVSPLMEKG